MDDLGALFAGKEPIALETYRALISALDKAAKRGVIHRNMANRRKARLNKVAAKTASPAS